MLDIATPLTDEQIDNIDKYMKMEDSDFDPSEVDLTHATDMILEDMRKELEGIV